MYAQYLAVNHGCQCKVVEYLATISPNVSRTVLSVAFVIEAIHLGDLARLMVPSYESDSIWVSYFKGEQKKKCLDTVETTIDEVT